ncbi:hypothetical protein OS493_006420 [Desmophyllum pertusum]|uniref:G-protein coupled receptors family 2 profile 2 domain-containing protein n=1 Tax=Desmophyllum pertusum TaxID=174260 RepID=A0A9X0DBD7_9CNID|nr:hypothetical protein OS493_006420 [Desmophyllum pertusum]
MEDTTDCEPCHNLTVDVRRGPPSLGGQDINSTEKTKLPPDEQREEKGVYFIMVMRLDLNVTNPSRNLYDLKVLIKTPAGRTSEVCFLKGELWLYIQNYSTKHDDIPERHQKALTAISYVGCALSAVGLTLTILTIALSRKLRRLRQNQILVYLCLSLLAAILLFTFGINGITDSDSLDLCKAMTALLHYFLLSSIVWMSIEAYNLYQDLVKVFDTTFISQNEFMCRAGVVGWIIPAVVVVITVLAEPDSYGFHVMDTNNETLCWMDQDAFYGAFLAPVLLLMVVNAIIFIVVMKEIYNIPHMCEKANRLSTSERLCQCLSSSASTGYSLVWLRSSERWCSITSSPSRARFKVCSFSCCMELSRRISKTLGACSQRKTASWR